MSRPIVATCGSGVSAAVLALALFRAGSTEVPVYDGSWSEWSRQAELPHS
ncbi:MAG: rhodanese-like domain-containing protein [Gammaproteobacteria bacterium]